MPNPPSPKPPEFLAEHSLWLQDGMTILLLQGLRRKRLSLLEQAAAKLEAGEDEATAKIFLAKSHRINLILEDIKNGKSDIWK